MKRTFFILVIGLLIGSCAPSRFVEPLQKKQVAVGANFGGPVLGLGAPIPTPLTAIEIGYGLDSNLTIHGGIHTTSAYYGNFQIDAGATYKVLNQNKYTPNVSINPGFNFIYDTNDKLSKFWPTFDANAYWNYGERRSYFYLGINNFIELSKTMANNQPQKQRWVLTPQVGHVLKSKNNNIQFTSEFKFIAPNQSNEYSFVPYKSLLGQYGATGFYLGLRYIFN